MQSAYAVLRKLEATSGTNDKINLLKSLKTDTELEEQFKKIAHCTYDPSLDYHVREFETSGHPGQPLVAITLDEALDGLVEQLDTRSITGHTAKRWVEDTYMSLDIKDAEVFKRVVKRDLRCNISVKTINKVWSGLIYEHPYMRCNSFKAENLKHINYPCLSQTKMDGLYVDIIIEMTKVTYRTRNGSFLEVNDPERDKVLIEKLAPCVIQGEALALNEDLEGVMERAASNGYLNSNNIDPKRVCFYVWDVLDISEFKAWKSKTPYQTRYNVLSRCVKVCQVDWLRMIDTVVCNNVDDVVDHFKQKRLEGEEGTVIKDYLGVWKPGTSKHQVKIKVVFECEMKVVDYKLGTGKNTDKLGALVFESSDGSIQVSVGTGYKDKDREQFLKKVNGWIAEGAVATVRANDISYTDNGISLFLPRFIEIRTDKNEADTLQRIKEQLDSCIDALKMIGG